MFGFQLFDGDGASTAAVLLVLQAPPARTGPRQAGGTIPAAALAALQGRLGAAVRVLQVDETNYPAIVRSFAPAQLPTSVLMHQGVELWRRQGLPNAAEIGAMLVARMGTPGC